MDFNFNGSTVFNAYNIVLCFSDTFSRLKLKLFSLDKLKSAQSLCKIKLHEGVLIVHRFTIQTNPMPQIQHCLLIF